MADEHSDLLMKLVKVKKGTPIPAETTTQIDLVKSDMTKDFKQGYFFELDAFTMQTGTESEDEDSKKQKADAKVGKAIGNVMPRNARNHGDFARLMAALRHSSENAATGYDKWRKGENQRYPVDMDPFEITRAIDNSSSIIWQDCIDRKTYDNATLIKRKAAGGRASGEAFLRMDFTKVLIIAIDWDQDDPIKEKIKFISRAVTIHYRPQLPDGSLGAAIQAFWTFNARYQPVNLKAL